MAIADSDSQVFGFHLRPMGGEKQDLPTFGLNSDDPLPDFDNLPDFENQGGNKSHAGKNKSSQPNSAAATSSSTPSATPPLTPQRSSVAGGFWLEGDTLCCACPQCRAPMAVRIWLALADCWNCGTSIELTEEQEREAQRLLDQQQQRSPQNKNQNRNPKNGRPAAATAMVPATAVGRPPSGNTQQQTRPQARQPQNRVPQRQVPTTSPTPPATSPVQRPADADPSNVRRRQRADAAANRQKLQRIRKRNSAAAWVKGVFDNTPAWVISAIFHFLLLTILALIDRGSAEHDGPTITLSTQVNHAQQEGELSGEVDPFKKFELPLPDDLPKDVPEETRVALQKANQEALELRVVTNPAIMPDVEQVKEAIKGKSAAGGLASRDPRVRVDMVKAEGGTTLTEAAVSRGLRWLSLHQNDSGSWSLHRFDKTEGGTKTGLGSANNDSAGTALALLPFLGAGNTHLNGLYEENVSKGVRWLIDNQKEDGDLRYRTDNTGMYAHGQAAIVLCELYGMTSDEAIREPAQKALDFIVKAQHPAGGWRYQPGQPGDTSVVGWQLMALQSGRASGLDVPHSSFELANQYLSSVSSKTGSQYAYLPGNRPTETMTAEGLLCRMYTGWGKDNPGLDMGVQYLLEEEQFPSQSRPNIYYWYYGTQTLRHFGGPEWNRWNIQMRDMLVDMQAKTGREAGSWNIGGAHSTQGGRIYSTSLATCTLEVYYRHLPIYRQIDLDR